MADRRLRSDDVDVVEFLARPLIAHLATASVDGPRNSPVWFLWEDEAIWLIGKTRTASQGDSETMAAAQSA